MGAQKKYNTELYEKKLETVMGRLGAEKFDHDYTRKEAWVDFWYKGQHYRFEHSIEKAAAHGQQLNYGSDAFCQIVLALEDLARVSGRGIYDLQTWVEGIKALPWSPAIPDCFSVLQFAAVPGTKADVQRAFRSLIKTAHPDVGGEEDLARRLSAARDECLAYLDKTAHP